MKKIELENGNYMIINHLDKEETKIYRKCYFDINNHYHRLNGPAVICYYRSGEIRGEHYWINGKSYSKEEYNKKININRNLKLLNKK